jgi:hypothetical protein
MHHQATAPSTLMLGPLEAVGGEESHLYKFECNADLAAPLRAFLQSTLNISQAPAPSGFSGERFDFTRTWHLPT